MNLHLEFPLKLFISILAMLTLGHAIKMLIKPSSDYRQTIERPGHLSERFQFDEFLKKLRKNLKKQKLAFKKV